MRIGMTQLMGIIALVLSLVSLLYTFQYNLNQGQGRVCTAIVNRDMIRALQARDEAILTLAQSNRKVVAGDPSALAVYDDGLTRYLSIVHNAPVPADDCLSH